MKTKAKPTTAKKQAPALVKAASAKPAAKPVLKKPVTVVAKPAPTTVKKRTPEPIKQAAAPVKTVAKPKIVLRKPAALVSLSPSAIAKLAMTTGATTAPAQEAEKQEERSAPVVQVETNVQAVGEPKAAPMKTFKPVKQVTVRPSTSGSKTSMAEVLAQRRNASTVRAPVPTFPTRKL